jgi:MFS family permease
MPDTSSAPGALSALRVGAFRALWLAGIVSNIGAWMQTVGAQWLLVEQHSPPAVVALVQTASSLPVLLLAIPAGVLGEFVNKRRLLLLVQTGQLLVVGWLTILTVMDAVPPMALLAFTLLLGIGSALQLPSYQAIVPEIVPVRDIPAAASLSSVAVNIARVIGPAVGGLVVASAGVGAVFALNALSFAVFLVTLLLWRGYTPRPPHPEHFIDATRAGLRYVRHSPVIRSIYLRLALFLLPAAGLWALLPVVASARLGLPSSGYGILLGALGAGSVIGAFVLQLARAHLGAGRVVMVSSALFGVSSAGLALAPNLVVAAVVLLPAGLAWLGVIATINAQVQAFLPPWVRTRGLSIYQLVLYGSTAVGSWLAGLAAGAVGAPATLAGCGALLVLVAVSLLVSPMADPEGIGRDVVPLPLTDVPLVHPEPDVDDDAVLVLVHYTVPDPERPEFRRRMSLVEQSRRRGGARTWELYDDPERPEVLTEAFTVGSWREHLEQHGERTTAYDEQVLEAAKACSTSEPTVEHLLSAPAKTRALRLPPAARFTRPTAGQGAARARGATDRRSPAR